MKKSYLWAVLVDDPLHWHALLVHDPEFVFAERVSDTLTRQARRRDPDAPEVIVRTVAETRPGTGQTLCRIGAERTKPEAGSGEPVRRLGVAIAKLGVDPEPGDLLCSSCHQIVNAA